MVATNNTLLLNVDTVAQMQAEAAALFDERIPLEELDPEEEEEEEEEEGMRLVNNLHV